jgi:uncharacterized repeat protein (TIGR01451 family)
VRTVRTLQAIAILVISLLGILSPHASAQECCPNPKPLCSGPLTAACSGAGTPPGTGPNGYTQIKRSADPNGKMTVGYGDQGFIPPNATITYTIYFENQPDATAPAARVVVTDPLDSNLDWSTVQLSEIGFNNVTLPAPGGRAPWQGRTMLRPGGFGR